MHTAHTEQWWVSSGLGPGRGMDTAQTRPKLGPTSRLESSRTSTLGSQHVPWTARACSKGRWEKEQKESTSQSPPALADCSRVFPKAKALHFSVNKVGIQLC